MVCTLYRDGLNIRLELGLEEAWLAIFGLKRINPVKTVAVVLLDSVNKIGVIVGGTCKVLYLFYKPGLE
jgi:hypothetical protein